MTVIIGPKNGPQYAIDADDPLDADADASVNSDGTDFKLLPRVNVMLAEHGEREAIELVAGFADDVLQSLMKSGALRVQELYILV